MPLDFTRKHGPVWGAVNAASASVAVTAITDVTGSSPWWTLAGGALVGGVAAGDALLRGLTRSSACWRLGCWLGAGGWSAWARFHEAPLPVGDLDMWFWNPANWGILAIGTAVAAISGHSLGNRRRNEQEVATRAALREQAQNLGRREDSIASEWERRLARVCKVGRIEPMLGPPVPDPRDPTGVRQVQYPLIGERGKPLTHVVDGVEVYGVEMWKDDSGRESGLGMSLDCVLPEGGTTWQSLSDYKINLAQDAKLDKGCGIDFEEGVDRGSFIMHVMLKDALVNDFPLPDDLSETSIRDDIHVAYEPHGRKVHINLYADNTTLTGEPDSGKTNTTHVVGAGILRTNDTLIVDIDVAGGGVSREYIREWAFNRGAAHPGVACVAPNNQVAYVVAAAVLNMIAARKTAYSSIMQEGRVPVAHSLEHGGIPQVVLRVDEGAGLTSAASGQRARDLIEQCSGQGRPANVRTLFGGLRPTDDYIPHGIIALSPNRLAMRTSHEDDLHRYLGWKTKVDTDALRHQGTGLVLTRRQPTTPVKYLWLSSEGRIREIARRTADRRPVLDAASVEAANKPIWLPTEDLITWWQDKPGFFVDGEEAYVENFWDNRWEIVLPLLFPDWDQSGTATVTQTGGAPGPRPSKAARVPATSAAKTSTSTGGAVNDLDHSARKMKDAAAEMAAAEARLAADVAAAEREQAEQTDKPAAEPAQPEEDPLAGVVIPDTAEAFLAAVDGQPPQPPAVETAQPWRPVTRSDKIIAMLLVVRDAGEQGIRSGLIIEALRSAYGLNEVPQTVAGWLSEQLNEGTLDQPWGRGPGAEDGPKGRYVVTEKGLEMLRRRGA